MNLQSLILDRLDEDSLFLLSQSYPSLKIDAEFKKRLESCDKEVYLPVLDFLLERKNKKSYEIRSGLYNLRNCFPWRIGVVYDFRTGRIENVEVRIGTGFGRYNLKGSKILFTWLDSFENKKMLRETISYNSKTSLFSNKLSKEKSMEIRDLILNNKTLNVDISIERKNVQSFPNNPLGENYVVFVTGVGSSNNYFLVNDNKNETKSVRFENVKIKFAPDVKKYLSVISY